MCSDKITCNLMFMANISRKLPFISNATECAGIVHKQDEVLWQTVSVGVFFQTHQWFYDFLKNERLRLKIWQGRVTWESCIVGSSQPILYFLFSGIVFRKFFVFLRAKTNRNLSKYSEEVKTTWPCQDYATLKTNMRIIVKPTFGLMNFWASN